MLGFSRKFQGDHWAGVSSAGRNRRLSEVAKVRMYRVLETDIRTVLYLRWVLKRAATWSDLCFKRIMLVLLFEIRLEGLISWSRQTSEEASVHGRGGGAPGLVLETGGGIGDAVHRYYIQ